MLEPLMNADVQHLFVIWRTSWNLGLGNLRWDDRIADHVDVLS
jgi:hypothetical protein